MRLPTRFRLICLLFLSATATVAAAVDSTPLNLHEQIQQVYNFHPHELNQDQIKEKAVVLDQFWGRVKAQSSGYVPILRRELADYSNPVFFFYDGGKLLLSLSDTPQDRKIIMAAFLHCDLRDVQLLDYFLTVHQFAAQGDDTTEVALRVLEEPNFRVFIAQHVMWLTQGECLVYLLMPNDPKDWMHAVLQRLKVENDETAQKSILLLLLYAQTDEADKAIVEFRNNNLKPAGSRDYAKQLLNQAQNVGMPDRLISLLRTEWSIRLYRRQVLKRPVSDEALYEFQTCTAQLAAKRARWWSPL